MSLARATLSGTISSEMEKRYTENNFAILTFNVSAVPISRAPNQSQEPYDVKVIAKGRLADTLPGQLAQGDTVVVDGKLQINNLPSPDGMTKKFFEIEAAAVTKVQGTLETLKAEQASQGASSTGPAPQQSYGQPAPSPVAVGAPASAPDYSPNEAHLTEEDIPF